MAKRKENAENVLPEIVIIRKHPSVIHKAPIKVSEFQTKDGKAHFMRFEKEDKEFKEYGERPFTFIVRDDNVELDLSNPIDNLKYRHLKQMKDLNLFPFEAASPKLEIIEPSKNDRDEKKFFDRKFKAMTILAEMTDPEDQREFAHYWGIHQGSNDRVFVSLKEKAESEPEEFLSAWEDPLRPIYILIRKAVDKGLITQKTSGVYYFGEEALGYNYDDIINSFAKDEAMATILSKRVDDA